MNTSPSRVILVMRHGEKPDAPGNPHLAPAGVARAQHLVTYIPQTFGKPDVIVASAVSADSSRPLETVQPLAQQCGLQVQTPYADGQFAEAAQKMLTDPGYKDQPLIVCCWHHGKIPKLMHALGCRQGEYPDPWDETVFNLILKVALSSNAVTGVQQIQEPF